MLSQCVFVPICLLIIGFLVQILTPIIFRRLSTGGNMNFIPLELLLYLLYSMIKDIICAKKISKIDLLRDGTHNNILQNLVCHRIEEIRINQHKGISLKPNPYLNDVSTFAMDYFIVIPCDIQPAFIASQIKKNIHE